MTSAQLKSLFSFNTAPTDSYNKGAGIALTICKEFVDKLNGRIWAESEPGKGSTFYFTVPDVDKNS
ncbi:hypothetical protein DJ568_14585 [Mucilaginibacter hurinus]|uniref:histidine kinase n=1 Tax=Mucilaginibacter hurinus TaxID=2201324 RepID=A0A367GM40_9SPHI|nr:ATP-binding protein [Mucilaginibacter hurinus]RCH54105.1 hypothetical protein DJ568_14585 [Mucilaginibacter hurinus]